MVDEHAQNEAGRGGAGESVSHEDGIDTSAPAMAAPGAAVDAPLQPEILSPADLSAEQRAVLLEPGAVVAGRFEVLEPLGLGLTGAVYRVRDTGLDFEKALKVLWPSVLDSGDDVERFLKDAGIGQRLRHDAIVRVYEVGEDAERGIRFFTMELIDGKPLNQLIAERGGKLKPKEALRIAGQVCDALAFAHRDTAHLNLKPQNIMVRPDGSIKLLDFGPAKQTSPERSGKAKQGVGVTYYQAPEHSVDGEEVDERADIYSLGVVIYQMLTGQIPLGRFGPPSKAAWRVYRGLDKPVMQCLEQKTGKRPSSVEVLKKALDKAARRRRRKWRISVLLCVLALVAGAGLYWWPAEMKDAAQAAWKWIVAPPEIVEPVTQPQPVVTADDASEARLAALEVQRAARDAGAEEHAPEEFLAAAMLLEEAEAHDAAKEFDLAVAKYQEARERLDAAQRISVESAAMAKAKAEAAARRAEAEALDAAEWAKARFAQAAEMERQGTAASSSSDRLKAVRWYREAGRLYGLATDEARRQGQALVAAARKDAEAARALAKTEDVRAFAEAELEAGETLFAQAGQVADFKEAAAVYGEAQAAYEKALEAAPERKQREEERTSLARGLMLEAKTAAQAVKQQPGGDERRYAAAEIASGDKAWAIAEEAGADYAWAEQHYREAQRQYEEALRVTPARKQAAEQPRLGDTYEEDLGNGVKLVMVWAPAGAFEMGSHLSAAELLTRYGGKGEWCKDEFPLHRVELEGFWLGKYEVTNAQYRRYISGHSSGDFKGHVLDGDDQPVVRVSWDEASAFCAWLSERSGRTYVLPTEAQWEYACRAGVSAVRYWGEDDASMGQYANVYDQTAAEALRLAWAPAETADGYKVTSPVGSLKPNAFELYDMLGNVWEFCSDWYSGDYYAQSPAKAPPGPAKGRTRVLRGGSWFNESWNCRASDRHEIESVMKVHNCGFRVCCTSHQR